MEQIENKNNDYLPRTYRNNCKKINVQLSLLYRFVEAYKNNPLVNKNKMHHTTIIIKK